jgi:hypothetical protein
MGNSPETAQRYYLHGVTKAKRAGIDSLEGVTRLLERKRGAEGKAWKGRAGFGN